MSDLQTVHSLYKNLGETPKEAILRFKKDHPEYEKIPMTYAGRLDPMAEGLLLILSGEQVKEKEKYLGLNKTYEFEILWGFETDTMDILGIDEKRSSKTPKMNELKKILENSKGKFEQKYPIYSSKPVLGKPLFEWAREDEKKPDLPTHTVEIFQSKFISRRQISSQALLAEIILRVSKVRGDFRQEKIIDEWKKVLLSGEKEFFIDKITIDVSSGFYVRQFVSDLAQILELSATTFHIKRTKIGDLQI